MSSEAGNVVAIVSGGMDSVTLAYYLDSLGHEPHLLSFDYGQKHRMKELECARQCAKDLGVEHKIVDLRSINKLLAGSALTDDSVEVPEGHYAHPTMAQTVVPNRNAIMLSIATGWAVSRGYGSVAAAVHAGDHPVYPDCRPEFIQQMHYTMRIATQGFHVPGFAVIAPFVQLTKAEIATLGHSLDVPYEKTWSCYKGGLYHCGACSTCFERREAFELAGVPDPTHYESTPVYEEPAQT